MCDKPGCGKRFSRPDSLTTHIKTHSNVRPFICLAKGCGKAYYHSRSLKKHEKTHEASSTPILSTPNSVIQYNTSASSATATSNTPFSTTSAPATGMHPSVQVDYLNSQMHQHQSPVSIHSQSLPNTPHPTLQQQNNFALLQQQQQQPSSSKAYTPNNITLSFPPAGLVEQQQQQQQQQQPQPQQQQQQSTELMAQQHSMFDSANQQLQQQLQQQQGFEFKQV